MTGFSSASGKTAVIPRGKGADLPVNFRSKALMAAKGISVWWGIYLIISCCACLSMKILLGIFGAEYPAENVKIMIFIPVVAGGSLFLAVISYMISSAAKMLPEKKFRSRADKILNEKGICGEYTSLLTERLRGDTKNTAYIELAVACVLSGDPEQAKKYIEQIDVLSVLDVAQSTGNYYTAAYYYAAAELMYLSLGKTDMAETAFSRGRFYFDELECDAFVTAVKAFGQAVFGETDEAVKNACAADELRHRQYKKGKYSHIQGLILALKAHVLFRAGMFEKADKAADEALKLNISAEYVKNMTELSREIGRKMLPEEDKKLI